LNEQESNGEPDETADGGRDRARRQVDMMAPLREALARQQVDMMAPLRETLARQQVDMMAPLRETLARQQVDMMAPLRETLARQASSIVDPVLPRFANLTASAAGQLPSEVFLRSAEASAAVIERISTSSEEISLDDLATEVAGAPGYADLWRSVEDEVEALLDDDTEETAAVAAVREKDAAAWHISWLLFSLRASLPTATSIETLMSAASIATTAIVACAVLRTAHPATWEELEKLHMTPFELAGWMFGLLGFLKKDNEK
jgi:hypothetical protein